MSTSSDPDPTTLISQAVDYIDDLGFAGFVQNVGIGGVFMAIVFQLIETITSIGGVVLKPLAALGDGLARLTEVGVGAPARLIEQGFETAITSFREGTAALLGPAAPTVSVIAAMAALFVFIWFVYRIPFSPIAFIRNIR